MQQAKPSRSNRERTGSTRQALLYAARALFISKGYGETSTPDICASTTTTRGTLYHLFADKRDLSTTYCCASPMTSPQTSSQPRPRACPTRDALAAGSEAYLTAMAVVGRTRLLLIDGHAVLGMAEIMGMNEADAANSLHEGLLAAGPGAETVSTNSLSSLLSAAFDRAALEINGGTDPDEVRAAMHWLPCKVLG